MGRVGALRPGWHVLVFEGPLQGHSLEPGTQVTSAHLLSGHMPAGGVGLPGLLGEGAAETRELQVHRANPPTPLTLQLTSGPRGPRGGDGGREARWGGGQSMGPAGSPPGPRLPGVRNRDRRPQERSESFPAAFTEPAPCRALGTAEAGAET